MSERVLVGMVSVRVSGESASGNGFSVSGESAIVEMVSV